MKLGESGKEWVRVGRSGLGPLNYKKNKALLIEKMCLALVFAVQKLRHYMQTRTMDVISKVNPIKYNLSSSVMNGWLAN